MANIVVNVRGPNGSGKSTAVRNLMKKLGVAKVLRDGKGKPWAYRLKAKKRVYILGRYETACGGCDTIGRMDEINELIRMLAEKGSVIFEGIIISTIGQRWVDLADSMPNTRWKFGLLDTPLEKCIWRVKRRQREKGKERDFKENLVADKYKAVHTGSRRILEKGGMDVRVLSHRHPVKTLRQWLHI